MSREKVEAVRRWFWAFENDTQAFWDTVDSSGIRYSTSFPKA